MLEAINGEHFATTVAAAGGQLAQLIRTVGLLYISLAENKEESGQLLTDLPLPRNEALDLTERAGRFGQLSLRPSAHKHRAGFSAVFGRRANGSECSEVSEMQV